MALGLMGWFMGHFFVLQSFARGSFVGQIVGGFPSFVPMIGSAAATLRCRLLVRWFADRWWLLGLTGHPS